MNYYAESFIGGRSENQDAVAVVQSKFGLLAVVCDGMGGSKGGRIASETALDIITNDLVNSPSEDPVNAVYNGIQKANFEVFRKALNDEELKGMGTTLALVLKTKEEAIIAHVGDSRVYQIRGKDILHRTYDHSVVFRMLKEGILTSEEQAMNHPDANKISRALGLNPVVDIELTKRSYAKGDYFFICSDGINGLLNDQEILDLHSAGASPDEVVKTAVKAADAKGNALGGGHDNASAISLSCEQNSRSLQTIPTSDNRPLSAKSRKLLLVAFSAALLIGLFAIFRLDRQKRELNQNLKASEEKIERLQAIIDSVNKKNRSENRTSGMDATSDSVAEETIPALAVGESTERDTTITDSVRNTP